MQQRKQGDMSISNGSIWIKIFGAVVAAWLFTGSHVPDSGSAAGMPTGGDAAAWHFAPDAAARDGAATTAVGAVAEELLEHGGVPCRPGHCEQRADRDQAWFGLYRFTN